MLLLTSACLFGLLLLRGADAAGCESNPCEHKCEDTADSYYCSCWPGYTRAPDQRSCINLKLQSLESLYMGCFEENAEENDFDHLVWERNDATVIECIRSCSSRSFSYAGLLGGRECWCDMTHQRRYNRSDDCTTPCAGAASEVCGGTEAISVYRAPVDIRYMGCWNENPDSRIMGSFNYSKTDGKRPLECIDSCNRAGFLYTALFDGGDCYCGNDYTSLGIANETLCNIPCYAGFAAANCGGNLTNAIYRTVKGNRFTPPPDADGKGVIDFNQNLIQTFPSLQGIITDRIIIHSSWAINLKNEDTDCFHGNCYESVCGTIPNNITGVDTGNTDMVIRDFHLKLTEIVPKYISGRDPQPLRVHVYVQTLVIDGNIDIEFSMYIRARQIIIDYSVYPRITFNLNSTPLNISLDSAVLYGPPSDLTFQKLSMMCARMLIGATNVTANQLGLNVIDDIVKDRSYTSEQENYVNSVRTARSNATSIGANGLHWVPYYSKTFYLRELPIYIQEVGTYVAEYDALVAAYEDCTTFLLKANALVAVWEQTILFKYEELKEDAEDALRISEEAYRQIYENYNASRDESDEAEEAFEEGLEKEARQSVIKAMFHLIRAFSQLKRGKDVDSGGVAQEISEAGDIEASKERLDVLMEKLGQTMDELFQFLIAVDEIMATEDYERYMDNVEAVASLYPMIIEWDNYKLEIQSVFSDETFRGVSGAVEYEVALLDVCNWGQALTKAVTEYANMIREYAKYDALHKQHEMMVERFKEYIEAAGVECDNRMQIAEAFADQNYDVMEVVNEVLFQFCEAYFFEYLQVCPDTAVPKFDSDPKRLLDQLNDALRLANEHSARSSLNLPITITDPVDVASNCSDWSVCPVQVLRDTKRFMYTLRLDEPRLDGIDTILINEIQVRFIGATSIDPSRSDLRLIIAKEGPFSNRFSTNVFDFYTRGLSDKTYQYDIESGATELSCDLLIEGGTRANMIQQAAPFTTWRFEVDPNYESWNFIDLSEVTEVEFTIIGSYDNLQEKMN